MRKQQLIIAAAVLALTLSGCGSNMGGSESSDGSSGESTPVSSGEENSGDGFTAGCYEESR